MTALRDLKVLDCSTLFAGPYAAAMLGDFGAEVIKLEHPSRPDPSRGHGPAKEGRGLWWTSLGRNKRTITANLNTESGRDVFRRLVAEVDVVIENFRPDTLERWNLGFEALKKINPKVVLVRVTGFGQTGPRRRDPGFGTLAEAMSGFAAVTGDPDGPPTLPPLALADGVAGITAAYAAMVALHARDTSGEGQVVDLALIEPLLGILGPQVTIYDQLGVIPERTGNRTQNNAPRNVYRTRDDRWLAVSTSAQSVAERVMKLVGRPDFIHQPWFSSGTTRAQHADELDESVSSWVIERTAEEALAGFAEAEAAASLVYNVADIVNDEQYAALETIKTVDDPHLGPVQMTNVLFRLSNTPGHISFAGRDHGADTTEVLEQLGFIEAEIADMRERGDV
ncbi:CaiB/BaiF CoA transferase family protein [Arthrobacter castelli]|uniref:CaiB/BaiF CoA transferase family protein n=1 Tax=Arthrobacter castelli TaxID=271431 RepID=UPI00042A04BF|nr:CoA transferase [Arthrobacter castelli]